MSDVAPAAERRHDWGCLQLLCHAMLPAGTPAARVQHSQQRRLTDKAPTERQLASSRQLQASVAPLAAGTVSLVSGRHAALIGGELGGGNRPLGFGSVRCGAGMSGTAGPGETINIAGLRGPTPRPDGWGGMMRRGGR